MAGWRSRCSAPQPATRMQGRRSTPPARFEPRAAWRQSAVHTSFLPVCWFGYTLNNVYPNGGAVMQVAKWGNSLAVRLPSAVVEALDLKEGDQIEIRIAGEREFEVARDRSKDNALARLRRLRRPLPAGFTFSRDEANAR